MAYTCVKNFGIFLRPPRRHNNLDWNNRELAKQREYIFSSGVFVDIAVAVD